jgi:hypothetical protein
MIYGYISLSQVMNCSEKHAKKEISLKPNRIFYVKIYREDDLWIAKNDLISLYVFSESLHGLKEEINDQIYFMWESYIINVHKKKLSASALKTKEELLSLFSL